MNSNQERTPDSRIEQLRNGVRPVDSEPLTVAAVRELQQIHALLMQSNSVQVAAAVALERLAAGGEAVLELLRSAKAEAHGQ